MKNQPDAADPVQALDLTLVEEQSARNRASRVSWSRYAHHRRNVNGLLLRLARPDARLLIVGAGNCNDVDLNQLRQHFAQIHLADIDGEAMRWGLRQQGLVSDAQFQIHEGVELTGISGLCSTWRKLADVRTAQVQQAIDMAQQHQWGLASAPFDVVASVGVLSQLIETVLNTLPGSHPRLLELVAALRDRHLTLMLQAVHPGGSAMLVTEVVSSDSCPELKTVTETGLPELLRQAIEAHNFYTGLNPAVLRGLWQELPELARLTEKVMASRPWLWDFGSRLYACCGLAAVRRRD